VRLDGDEIGIPDAEPTGVNGPVTVSAHDDGPNLSISAQECSISRTKAVIGWVSVRLSREPRGRGQPMRKTSRREVLAGLAISAGALKATGLSARAKGSDAELTGRVVTPADPGYDRARWPWSRYLVDRPRLVVFAEKPDDVVNGIAWARQNGVPLRARSGRHALAPGLSSVDGGAVIDVSALKDVAIDTKAGTATVGTGLTQGEVVEALGATGHTVPTGSEASVGIAGVTLGGGIGTLSRSLGVTCDSLIGLDIVVPDGTDGARLISANETSHADLLWACRGGGGGNFGIATSFTFRIHPIGEITHFKLDWDWSDPAAPFEAWESLAPTADRNLGSTFVFLPRDSNVIEAEGIYRGNEEDLRKLLAPLLAVGSPKVTMESGSYADHFKKANAGPRQFYNWQFTSSWIREPLPAPAVDTIIRFMSDAPAPACNYWCLNWGEATRVEPPGGTAFVHRDALYYAEPGAGWNDPAKTGPVDAWLSAFGKAMRPFVYGAYVNVPDPTFSDWGDLYYGDNFARLREVKRRYDPHDVFSHPQSIPPA
jgi:FAD binding domain/Berberine and berberine like